MAPTRSDVPVAIRPIPSGVCQKPFTILLRRSPNHQHTRRQLGDPRNAREGDPPLRRGWLGSTSPPAPQSATHFVPPDTTRILFTVLCPAGGRVVSYVRSLTGTVGASVLTSTMPCSQSAFCT